MFKADLPRPGRLTSLIDKSVAPVINNQKRIFVLIILQESHSFPHHPQERRLRWDEPVFSFESILMEDLRQILKLPLDAQFILFPPKEQSLDFAVPGSPAIW